MYRKNTNEIPSKIRAKTLLGTQRVFFYFQQKPDLSKMFDQNLNLWKCWLETRFNEIVGQKLNIQQISKTVWCDMIYILFFFRVNNFDSVFGYLQALVWQLISIKGRNRMNKHQSHTGILAKKRYGPKRKTKIHRDCYRLCIHFSRKLYP